MHEFCKIIRENRPPTPKVQRKLTGDLLRYCLFGPFSQTCQPDKSRLGIKAILRHDYRVNKRGKEGESLKNKQIERLAETMLDAIIVRCVLRSKL